MPTYWIRRVLWFCAGLAWLGMGCTSASPATPPDIPHQTKLSAPVFEGEITVSITRPLTSTPSPTGTPTPALSPTNSPALPASSPTNPPALLAPSPTITPTPYAPSSIILVVVDSLRADHVSGYGYERPVTQNLDQRVAAQGVQFQHALASAPWTCPSNAAMMSGMKPSTWGDTWTPPNRSLPSRAVTLAELLSEAGYLTIGFVNNTCVAGRKGFYQGFDYYDDSVVSQTGIHSFNKFRAEAVNGRVITWLDQNWVNVRDPAPLFLLIYYMDPHVWYDPPPPYRTLYDPDYFGPVLPDVFKVGKEAMEGTLTLTERDNEHLAAMYDGEITYWDQEFGKMIDYLDQIGLLDTSLLVLTSDHGEMIGEHNLWNHGNSLYEEVLRVPLLMRFPGVIPAGRVVNAPVQMIDLMPTVLDYAGIPIPVGLDAISLKPVINQEVDGAGRPIFSELDAVTNPDHWGSWQTPRVDLRAVRLDNWKLIQHVGDSANDELYQIGAKSPFELENLLVTDPERVQAVYQELLAFLSDW